MTDSTAVLAGAFCHDSPTPTPTAVELTPSDFPPGERRLAVIALNHGADAHGEVLPALSQEALAEIAERAPDLAPLVERVQRGRRWIVMSPHELLQPPRPPEYLIDGILRLPSLSCLYGAPGDLKSFLMADLAVCVAAGLPWLEPLPVAGTGGPYRVRQGPVLWLDLDNGIDRLRERFGALLRTRGITAEAPLWAVSLPHPPFDASNPDDTRILAAEISSRGAVLCVVDNLGTASGGRDENSAQMIEVMANLRMVAEECRCAIVVIHHARKGAANGGRDGDRLRGHSSIEASLDLALLVERDGDDVTIRSTKTRDDPVRPYVARWRWTQDSQRTLQSARFWHVRLVDATKASPAITDRDVQALLTDGRGPNQTELSQQLMEQYGISRAQALKHIQHAADAGIIRAVATGPGRTSPKRYYPSDIEVPQTAARVSCLVYP